MKLKPLYVFATIIHLIWISEATVLHDLENKISEGKGCTIPNKWQEFRCDVDHHGPVIPEGTKCTVLSDDTHVLNYLCESGMLIALQHTYKGTNEHHIQKRFWGAVFAGVGALVGIAAGVIGIVCSFTACNPSTGETPAPNKPPIITCPTVRDQFANKLQETVNVFWTEPTAADPEGKDVGISSSGDPSGSKFGRGNHAILYTATDDVGNKDSCLIRFRVTVIYCLGGQYVENGKYECDTTSNIYGTVCSVSCNRGYMLPDNSIAKKICGENSTWTPSTTMACEKKNCSVPQNPCNGKLTCSDSGYTYLSKCYPTCNRGYETDTTKRITCDVNGWIGQIDDCQDVQRPTFSFCPQTIHKFADRGTSEVVVQWTTPTVIDNSQNDETCGPPSSVIVKQISGLIPGSRFSIGIHELVYSATDNSNNVVMCNFTVIVEELTCQPLSLEDKYVLVSCEEGYKYGASCSFSCFMSYELVGDVNVTCERNSSDENAAYWNWTNNTESYCEKLLCPELPAPVGGALACSTALGTPICSMACAKPNVVPLGTSVEYICDNNQVWQPGIPPNCTDYIHPRMATLGGEVFYYYDGDCSNQSVQTSIKQNFVDVMVEMENSDKWKDDLCPDYCTTEAVTVKCGPRNGRRRKRSSSNQINVTFTLMSTWQVKYRLQVNDEIINKMGEHMQSKVTEGAFDYPGVTTGSMVVGVSDYYCPEGQKATYSDDAGLCNGCPPGKFLHNGDCIECAKGYYQDKEYQINCTECPDGQLTEKVGSTTINDCQDICQPGTFSKTGLVPCSSCLRGQFQQEAGAVTCLPCPDQMFTKSTGSASQSDCTLIDVQFTSDSGLLSLPTMEKEIQNFTLSFIMKHGDSVEQGLQFKLGSFEMSSGKQIKMTVGSETRFFNYSTTGDSLADWKHVVITWYRLERKSDIFINGQKRTTFAFTAFTDEEIELPISQTLEIKAKAAGLTLTGLVFDNSILSDTLINQLAENCSPNLSSVMLTMKNVFMTDSKDTELSLSKCDVINECKTNPCGNGNICINEQNGYSCQCLSGYSGTNCDIPPDFCKVNGCKNGASCISNFDSYSCVCDSSFTGPICETEIMHGNWGLWPDWSECSQSCNGGTQSRVRYCDDPVPNLYGRDCPGTNMSLQACNTDPCPVCPSHSSIYSYKNSFDCMSISDSTSCVVTCQDGFRFARDYKPLDQYECGPQTGYIWNAFPPPCARSISPRSVSATVAVMHNDVDCSNEESVSATLKQNMNNLQCVENNTCTVSTSTYGCGSSRQRSTETSLHTNIQIISLQLEKPLNLEELYSNNIVSPGLLEMVMAYIDLTMSLNQLNTTDVLTIDDKGTVYSADLSSLKIATVITCPDGTVEQELMCDECPFGTYWSNGTCVMCPKGTYQDESGQVNCKNCPVGLTTHYIASRNESECAVADPVAESPVNESSENQTGVIVPIAVGAIIAFGVMVFLVFFVRKKHRESTRTKGKISRCASVVNTNMIHPTLEESHGEQIDPTPAEQNNFEMGYPWTMEHEMIGKMRFQSLPPIDNRQLITDKILPRQPMLSPIGHVSPDPTA